MEFPLYDHHATLVTNQPDPPRTQVIKYFTIVNNIRENLETDSEKNRAEVSRIEEFLNTIFAFILHHHYLKHPKNKLKNPPYKAEIPNGGRGIKYIEADKKLDPELIKILCSYIKNSIDLDD